MTRMTYNEVQHVLAAIQEVKEDHLFFDCHVHPYEVMFDPCPYAEAPDSPGLYVSGTIAYQPPTITGLDFNAPLSSSAKNIPRKFQIMASTLTARRIYAHSGPRVFSEQMRLCGIDRLLMLPVAAADEQGDAHLAAMIEMFGSNSDFMLACCIGNDVADEDVDKETARLASLHPLAAMKIHPNVTGINPAQPNGKERIERMLTAAHNNRLPIVMHGGLSPECKNPEMVDYATLRHLRHINWDCTVQPVIIAHAGSYGYGLSEVERDILPILKRVLEHHDHLYVDTSGLSLDVLALILKHLDSARILFGSDALYEKSWSAMVKLWAALDRTGQDKDHSFLQMISGNPQRVFGCSS